MNLVKVVLSNGHVEFLRFQSSVELDYRQSDAVYVVAVDGGNTLAVVITQNVAAVMLSNGN